MVLGVKGRSDIPRPELALLPKRDIISVMTKLQRFRRLQQLEAKAWGPVSSVQPVPFGTDPTPVPLGALTSWARRRKAVDRAARLLAIR